MGIQNTITTRGAALGRGVPEGSARVLARVDSGADSAAALDRGATSRRASGLAAVAGPAGGTSGP